jgi:hypothetical protein
MVLLEWSWSALGTVDCTNRGLTCALNGQLYCTGFQELVTVGNNGLLHAQI